MKYSKYIKSFVINRGRSGKNDDFYLSKFEEEFKFDKNKSKFDSKTELTIEIGSGCGDFAVNYATKFQDRMIVACEVYRHGVVETVEKAIDAKCSNLLIHQGDARFLIEEMTDCSVNLFVVLFPDPWPKNKHNKRRIVNIDLINLLLQKLKNDGSILIGSDHADYIIHIREVLSSFKNTLIIEEIDEEKFITNNEFGYTVTKYHRKAMNIGIKSTFFILKKIS